MSGPLDGIRVVEMGHALAGPLAGTFLADFGAEVIKVERPDTGDSLRNMGPKFKDKGIWWAAVGRNKHSVCIDFKQEAGRDLVLELLAGADVLVENFRPGVLERAGLGWDELAARFPRLVVLRVSGFGQTGPYHERPGFGKIGEAFSGATHLTGQADAPPVHPGYSLGDATTGLMGAFGVMMALFDRTRTDRGQLVDLALYEPMFRLIDWQVPMQQLLGQVPMRNGTRFPFDGAFITDICATSDGEGIVVSAATSVSLERLRAFVRGEGLMPAEGGTDIEVVDGLRTWARAHTRAEALDRLESEGLVVGSVLNAKDLGEDPHIAARGNIVRPLNESGDEFPMPSVLPSLSANPGEVRWPGPRLGAHTEEVLSTTLGLDREKIQELADQGVVGLAEVGHAA